MSRVALRSACCAPSVCICVATCSFGAPASSRLCVLGKVVVLCASTFVRCFLCVRLVIFKSAVPQSAVQAKWSTGLKQQCTPHSGVACLLRPVFVFSAVLCCCTLCGVFFYVALVAASCFFVAALTALSGCVFRNAQNLK